MILQVILWVFIVFNVIALCYAPFSIGRPRDPYGPAYVLYATLYSIVAICTYLYIIFGVLK